jgi:lauroyl/myristoyl acyltransferase
MHFRNVKNVIARPLHQFGRFVAGLPPALQHAVMWPIGAAARTAYFAPEGHLYRTVNNFCHVTGRSDPWPVYSRMVANIQQAALHFARLHRYGREQLVAQTTIDPQVQAECGRLAASGRGFIIVVPHCIGAALSSARLSTFCKTVLLVREPRDPARSELMVEYLEKLGPEFILVRKTPPAVITRRLVRALLDGKVVVGTTDLAGFEADMIQTHAFGQPIYSPIWPATLFTRLKVPILPGYIHMEGGQIRLMGDEGYLETNILEGTQRWVSSFERRFRQYPSDWAFMLDKNWARVFAAAAAQSVQATATNARPSCSYDDNQGTPQRG